MRLLAYIRVSTDDQAETGHSLRVVQPQQLSQYCALHGHQIVGSFADDVSASVPLSRRPQGRRMLAALKAGEADGVVATRLDRLFRDALDGLRFFEDAGRRKVAVHVVHQLIDTTTPAGRLNLTLHLATAQYERDLAVERGKESSRGLRKAGRVYGHTPFGCAAIDGRLYRDPATWPTRERIARLHAEGESYGAIRKQLRAEGVPSPQGEAMWGKSVLAAICDLHGELVGLPELPPQAVRAAAAAHETGGSRARAH